MTCDVAVQTVIVMSHQKAAINAMPGAQCCPRLMPHGPMCAAMAYSGSTFRLLMTDGDDEPDADDRRSRASVRRGELGTKVGAGDEPVGQRERHDHLGMPRRAGCTSPSPWMAAQPTTRPTASKRPDELARAALRRGRTPRWRGRPRHPGSGRKTTARASSVVVAEDHGRR